MIDRLANRLHRLGTGWAALAATVLFFLFTMFVLPGQMTHAEAYSAQAGSPDGSLLYRPADLYRMAEAYGDAGRTAYVRARFTFDLIWPVVYGLFLVASIGWVYGRVFPAASNWQRAVLAPLGAVAFDYLENMAASIVMLRYPDATPVVDWLTPIFTFVKWTLVAGSFALLALGIGVGLWRWFRELMEA